MNNFIRVYKKKKKNNVQYEYEHYIDVRIFY